MRSGDEIAAGLRLSIQEGLELLSGVPESRTAARPGGGGWCAREIIGHLIDSACINHRRFVVNQTADVLRVEPYDQNAWVTSQRHADRPAAELITLWAAYNHHLAHVIAAIPGDAFQQPRGAAAGLGFSYLSPDDDDADLASLRILAEDYVGHIRHHLRQLRDVLAVSA